MDLITWNKWKMDWENPYKHYELKKLPKVSYETTENFRGGQVC